MGTFRADRINGWRARLVLGALALLFGISVLPGRTSRTTGGQQQGSGADMALHHAIISRLGANEPYHAAVGTELRIRGYPTGSVFNWRTPLLHSALAARPRAGRLAFVVAGLLVLAATVILLSSRQVPVVIVGALAQSGAIGVMFDPALWVFHEVWAGYLIALSAFAFAYARWMLGAMLGILALFVRELAAPYSLVCVFLAWRAGRRGELRLWLAGLICYGVYYGWHYWLVTSFRQGGDVEHISGWLQFGGPGFIVSSLRTNAWFHDSPLVVVASALVLTVAGLFHAAVTSHVRYGVLAFLVFFAIVGQPFNWYWGWIPGLLEPVALAFGVPALALIIRSAFGLPTITAPTSSSR